MTVFSHATGSKVASSHRPLWRVLLEEDGGQDLVEYALMASFIGVAGYLIVSTLGDDIRTTYQSWIDPDAGTPTLWDPPDPMGGSGS